MFHLRESMKLYLVTDRLGLQEKSLAEAVEEAVRNGVTMVQLREKKAGKKEIMQLAGQLQAVCKRYKIPLIMNDSPELARETEVDGVHIGQADGGIKAARAIIGEGKIIGATAHNVKEALQAEKDGADYIGAGAIFTSSTKSNTVPLPIEDLREMCRCVTIPVVAIGGIQEENVHILQGSGIDGIAVVSAILSSRDIGAASARLRSKVEEMLS